MLCGELEDKAVKENVAFCTWAKACIEAHKLGGKWSADSANSAAGKSQMSEEWVWNEAPFP